MKVDPEPLKAQIKVEVTKAAQEQKVGGFKIREIDGAQFVVHDVKSSDSLTKLSLVYNVPIKTIKNVNGLMADQIFQLREILIPVTPTMNLGGAQLAPKTAD